VYQRLASEGRPAPAANLSYKEEIILLR
jgi:hypothetical protein